VVEGPEGVQSEEAGVCVDGDWIRKKREASEGLMDKDDESNEARRGTGFLLSACFNRPAVEEAAFDRLDLAVGGVPRTSGVCARSFSLHFGRQLSAAWSCCSWSI